jgi:hypothetical protein
MSRLRELAYAIDPALWVQHVLEVEPAPWQAQFLRAPRGASIIALTARQVGKTTAAAWGITHYMLFTPGGLSVIACPAQRQSKEAVRRVRDILIKVGADLKSDNIYELELTNGSRVLALPSTDDSIRGLTVDGFIIADEAARLPNDLIAALRPMRARREVLHETFGPRVIGLQISRHGDGMDYERRPLDIAAALSNQASPKPSARRG